MQTQQKVSKGVFGMAVQVVRSHGALAFYNGLTASLGRQVGLLRVVVVVVREGLRRSLFYFQCFQLTYSSVRFGVYDIVRPRLEARIQGGHLKCVCVCVCLYRLGISRAY